MCELEDRFGKYDGFEYKPRVPRNRLVERVGINDAPFNVSSNGVKHRAYVVWQDMLRRVNCSKVHARQPTYADTLVNNSWHTFTNFAIWYYKQGGNTSKLFLDKDIKCKDNREYGPDTCILVSRGLNQFMTLSNTIRGDWPIGVSIEKSGRFKSQISISNKHVILGYFDTPEQAHQAWQRAKLEQAIAFDFQPLQRVINQLKFEIENNLETTIL